MVIHETMPGIGIAGVERTLVVRALSACWIPAVGIPGGAVCDVTSNAAAGSTVCEASYFSVLG